MVRRSLRRPVEMAPSTSDRKKKKKKKPLSLSAGRPPVLHNKTAPTLSSRATRTLIRSHHTLHKQLARAEAAGDTAGAADIRATIDAQGGLRSYQTASIHGQASERGGDSSRVLVEWLRDGAQAQQTGQKAPGLRMLEVGALSTTNACARSPLFADVTRIDLRSQDRDGILEQDFMARPLPDTDADRFDVVSLSLVLNYVPDVAARGDMLRRTTQFLAPAEAPARHELAPSLFLVLPVPCVANSRYLTEQRLADIMGVLGYAQARRKLSAKLAYSLWTYDASAAAREQATFKKVELNPGRVRNNFAIVLR